MKVIRLEVNLDVVKLDIAHKPEIVQILVSNVLREHLPRYITVQRVDILSAK